MIRSSSRLRLLALAAAVVVVAANCGTGTPPASSGTAPSPISTATGTAPGSSEPWDGTSYPTAAEVDCDNDEYAGKPYTGNLARIEAVDRLTVRFSLCASDVAFLSKVAFASYAINDTAWLEAHVPDGSIVSQPNGTGPYKLATWDRGSRIVLEANADYWGGAPPVRTVEFRWSSEAAQRLVELQAGTVDGIDNVGTDDIATVQGDSSLALYPREGLNVFYLGMNNRVAPFDNEQVRQAIAMGIDRDRIVSNFYPGGSVVASHFAPCDLLGGCEGPEWHPFDPEAARELLADAGFPDGFTVKLQYRDVVRGYLPEPAVVAQDLQAQLKTNLNITAEIEVQESGAFIDNANNGRLDGLFMLGWGADYPDVTNFLDYHFTAGSPPTFGDAHDDIDAALRRGATSVDEAERKAAYAEANELIRTHVPMVPIAHGGSAVAFRADAQGAHASPLTNESMAAITVPRDTLVWMQNAEPLGAYCADESDGESLRLCEQISESLYSYEVGGTAAHPSLAEECVPNDDLSEWTCSLRDGVRFHDGATLDANDVVLSYAVQWDAEHPLHKGRDGSFPYFAALWGDFLNRPPEE